MSKHPHVLHADLDAFFAAVEVLDDPSLDGVPLIVGGAGPRGVVATCSYQARLFGVHSAMPMHRALLACPDAVVVAPRKERYAEMSRQVFEVFDAFADVVEAVSVDEAYLDVTSALADQSDDPAAPLQLCERLRTAVHEATGLTVSVGLAPTKSAAKLASEAAKPDGLRVVSRAQLRAFLADHPVRAVPGVGPATERRLLDRGITHVAHLAAADPERLEAALGPAKARHLVALARGEDDRPVAERGPRKQVSAERTFETDLVDGPALREQLDAAVARLHQRLAAAGRAGRTVTLKLRYADFSTHTRSRTLPAPVRDRERLAAIALELLTEQGLAGPVRLLGVGLSSLVGEHAAEDGGDQLTLPLELAPPVEAAGRRADGPSGARRRVVHDALGLGWLVADAGPDRVMVAFDCLGDSPINVARTSVADASEG